MVSILPIQGIFICSLRCLESVSLERFTAASNIAPKCPVYIITLLSHISFRDRNFTRTVFFFLFELWVLNYSVMHALWAVYMFDICTQWFDYFYRRYFFISSKLDHGSPQIPFLYQWIIIDSWKTKDFPLPSSWFWIQNHHTSRRAITHG